MRRVLIGIFSSIIFLFCFSLSDSVKAEKIVLKQETESLNLGKSLYYIEDVKGSLTFSQIQEKFANSEGKLSEKAVPNFGFTDSTYWFYFKLLNQSNGQKEWLLEVGYPLLDTAEFHIIQEDGTVLKKLLGDSLPYANREFEHRHFVLKLGRLKAGQEQTFYVKVKTQSAFQFPLKAWDLFTFMKRASNEVMVIGLMYGALVIMALYNLFIFVITRDRSYFHLVGFIVFYLLNDASLKGFGFQYLWPESLFLADKSFILAMCISAMFTVIVTQVVLNTKQISPRAHKYLTYVVYIDLILFFLAFFLPYKVVIKPAVMFLLPSIALIFYSGIKSYRIGFPPAKFFLLAWGAFLFGSALMAANKLGFIPRNPFTENGVLAGAVMQVALLSFALANKITVLQEEKEQAQEEATKSLEEQVYFLKEINNTTAELCSNVQLYSMLDNGAQDLTELLKVRRTSIYLLDSGKENLQFITHFGEDPPGQFKEFLPVNYGLFSKVIETKRSLYSNFEKEDSNYVEFDGMMEKGTKNIMCVPLMDQDEPMGIVCITDKMDGRPFEERHKNIAETISTSIQISLQNIKLLAETADKVRMEKELQTATAVQNALIPATDPKVVNSDIAGYYQAASETGGDWYGFIDEGKCFHILIGDVTGHGTPSALITASVRGISLALEMIVEEKKEDEDFFMDPGSILEKLNKTVYRTAQKKYFMTFFSACYFPKTGRLVYANAGHNFPWYFKANDGRENARIKASSLLVQGPVLGYAENSSYTSREVYLNPGDLVVFYTDGLIECENKDFEEYGKRNAQRAVGKVTGKKSHEIKEKLIESAFDFYGDYPRKDDITLVILKIPDDAKFNTDNISKKSA